jgi:hypothetical protein
VIRSHRAPSGVALILATAAWAALPAPAGAWGGATHHYIARNYSQHLPAEIDGLRAYDSVVDEKVTDPDTRKSYTPGESSRHYIDIDAYPEFLAGTLSHDRAALEQEYGVYAVLNHGVLPWATGEVMATLTQQFQARQWSQAATTIADLCHYVGDATQPLHCTQNYDGQQSGNDGIHARYESDMMALHLGELHTAPATVAYYPSAVEAMFGIIAASWADVSTLTAADTQAQSETQGQFDGNYYASLWFGTESATRERIDAATLATASFVYTAWVNAGRPYVPGSSGGTLDVAAGVQLDVGPTPFRDALAVRFGGAGPLSVDVFDVRGTRVERVVDRAPGGGSISWRPAQRIGSGVYFIRLSGPNRSLVRRVTRIR